MFDFTPSKIGNALHFRDGHHDLTLEDWDVILDFADWQFRSQEPGNPQRFFQHR